MTVVWIGVDGDQIVMGHLTRSKKVRNAQRGGRVSLSLLLGGRNAIGLDYYTVVDGTADVVEGGPADLLQSLAYVDLGPDVTFPPMPDPPSGLVLRTTPTAIHGVFPCGEPQ